MADNTNNINVNANLPLQQPPPQQAIHDYFQPTINQNYFGIARQPINANNFELKPALISMVQQIQFGRSVVEDPNTHLAMFLEICDTIKMNGVPDDAIRLCLFPFCLRDKLRLWLQSFTPCSIPSWNNLTQKFLAKYFPPTKILQLKSEIAQFRQQDFEPLYEAWERFNKDWQQVQYFYNGLNGQTQTIIEAAACGTLMSKTANEAHICLEEMATNSYQWPSERFIYTIAAQVSALSNQIAAWTSNGASQGMDSMASTSTSFIDTKDNEQVNFVNNHNFNFRGNQLPTHYHPRLRNHENFSYANNRNVLQPLSGYNNPPHLNPRVGEKKASLENLISTFIRHLASSLGAQMKSMETQIGQLATEINAQKHKGNFPSDTEMNPREHCKAIQLQSRTKIKGSEMQSSKVDEPMASTSSESPMEEQPNEEEMQSNEQTKVEKLKSTPNFKTSKFNVPIPFPQRFQKKKIDSQFAKFLKIFKKIHINIPFADALEQMPNYTKFMKDVILRKRQLVEFEIVNLTEKCSAILQKKLPKKLKDLGSFTIPCTIRGSFFDKALCDLGAKIGEVKSSTITLQLVDRSLTYPRGVVEDVLVKVDKFIFPADFVVLDMEEDQEIPLILGRSFLTTGHTLIDVQ
ncbi:hypothetical protein Pfo_005298 [Paulownia fortunei]|nr:hypothetical protein Pfo_005298 [Paulownia fortunei]